MIPDHLSFAVIPAPNNPILPPPVGYSGEVVWLRFADQAEQRAAFVAAGFTLKPAVLDREGNEVFQAQTWASLGNVFEWPGVGAVVIGGTLMEQRAPDENGEYDPPLETLPGWHVNLLVA